MTQNTAIQWCDSTENPTMGCDGCELWNSQRQTCYAGGLHRRFGANSTGYAPRFEQVTQFPGRMRRASRWSDLSGRNRENKPWLNGMPRLIFVSDMSDALSKAVSFEYLREEVIENVISDHGRRHRWLWLTKRPHRMAEFSRWLARPWPSNLWIATSITTQNSTSRLNPLFEVGDEATTRFLSVEPQWEAIDLEPWLSQIDWVIQGGESGVSARAFHEEWAESLTSQCRAAGVPYFLKQLGTKVYRGGQRIRHEHSHGGNWDEWPEHLRVRQFPTEGVTIQASPQ